MDSRQTTEARQPPSDAIVTVEPAPSLRRLEYDHHQHRFFLGPMPVSVATKDHTSNAYTESIGASGMGKRLGFAGIRDKLLGHSPEHRRSLSSEDAVSRERAFQFFLREGGRPEEFESQESGVKEEILRRVQRTRWFQGDSKGISGLNNAPSGNWVGDTFEIGKDLLGLSTLAPKEEEPAMVGRISLGSPRQSFSSPEAGKTSIAKNGGVTSTRPRISFQSSSSSSSAPRSYVSASSNPEESTVAIESNASSPGDAGTSTTRLMTPPVISRGPSAISAAYSDTKAVVSAPARPDLLDTTTAPVGPPLRSALRPTDGAEGHGKAGARVKFPESTENLQSESPISEQPAAPADVLTREPTVTTSAGAAARINDELEPDDDTDVLIRGMPHQKAIYWCLIPFQIECWYEYYLLKVQYKSTSTRNNY